jgi:hypothetical protein
MHTRVLISSELSIGSSCARCRFIVGRASSSALIVPYKGTQYELLVNELCDSLVLPERGIAYICLKVRACVRAAPSAYAP